MLRFYNKIKERVSKSVIITWLVSYVLILLIPAFSSMFQFLYTNAFVVNQVNQSNEQLLSNIQHNIDSIFDTLISSNTTSLYNEHFQRLLNLNSNESEFRYELKTFVNNLYTYKQVNPMVDITIYMPEGNYLINSSTANHISYIYGDLKSKDNSITEEEWIDKLKNTYRDSYVISPYMSYEDFGKDSMVFVRSVLSGSRLIANIFVSIPSGYIESISGISSGSFLIFNEDEEVIESFHGNNIPKGTHFHGNNGRETVYVGAKPYILSYVKSNKTDLYYADLIPKHDFWQKANYVKVSALTSIIIALTLCVSIVVSDK